jgi:BASS family bile acid:Na+ symporter
MKDSILTSTILPAALALIMFGMGLSLTLLDFKRIAKYPKAVCLGAFNQLVLLPVIAYGLILLFGLEGGLAVGLMVIAACPGGTTSNIITHVSKGDTALSVTLTAISSVVTIFSIPLIVNFALNEFIGVDSKIQLPLMKTFGALMVITIIPIAIGMIVKNYNNNFALKMEKPVKIASIVIFMALVAGIILKNKAHILHYFEQAGTVAITLNIVTMAIGFGVARLFKLNKSQAITISIESGIQNGTLALIITLSLIQNATDEMSIAPAIYSILMFFTGGFMMSYFGGRKKRITSETVN